MNIIMAVCMYPIILILYAILRGQRKPRGGLLFGARLAEYLVREPEVEEICKRFTKRLNTALWVSLLVPVVFFFIPLESVALLLWVVWCFVFILLLVLPNAKANGELRRWKESRGLNPPKRHEVIVELRQMGKLRITRLTHFIPAIVLTVAGVVLSLLPPWDGMGFLLTIIFAVLTPLVIWCALLMEGMSLKVISQDSDINLNYNRALRKQWQVFWQVTVLCNALVTLAMGIACFAGGFWSLTTVTLWAGIAYIVVVLGAVGWLIWKQNKLNDSYRDKMDLAGEVDDDDNWLWGSIYYNPHDKRVNVPKRFGVGATINMATTAGKIISVVVALVIVSSVAFCFYPVALELNPVYLELEGETLVAGQLKDDYVIPLDEVERVVLLTALPELRRTNGTSLDNLMRGTYRLRDGNEDVRLLLNPQNSYYLALRWKDTTYIFSAEDDDQTQRIYKQMQ